jgi:hypothetical protein
MERRAGRHHVVDDRHAQAGERAPRGEGPAHVAGALARQQRRLRRGVAHAHEPRQERDAAQRRDAPGDLRRLVEASLALARRCERQRHQRVEPARRERHLGERAAERVGVGELPGVLERLDHAIDRKFVAERRHGEVDRRRSHEAVAAARTPARWQRASRAGLAEAGEPPATRPADGAGRGASGAQHALRRKQRAREAVKFFREKI